MPDSEKKIRFKTSIEGSDEVKRKFEDINDSIENTSNTVDNKLSPSMDEAKQYTMRVGEAAQGTTSKFAGLAAGILGGAGVVAAFAVGQLVVTAISDALKKANEESDMLAASFQRLTEQMIRVQNPFKGGFFDVKPEQLESLINGLDIKIKALESQATTFARLNSIVYAQMTQEEIDLQDAKIERNEVLLAFYTKEKIEIEARKELMDMMNEAGVDWNDGIKDATKKQKEYTKELKGTLTEFLNIIRAIERGAAGSTTLPLAIPGMVPVPRKPLIQGMDDFEKEQIKKDEKYQQDFADSFTNILETNFHTFWEATFGEANSLLEQLLQATVGGIIASFASSLLSLIPFGGFISGLFGGGGASGASPGGNQPILIQLGGEDVARVVLEGNRVIQQRRLS